MMFDLMCNCLLVATIFFLSGLQRLESSVFFVVIFAAIFTGYSCIIQARCIFRIWISNNSSINNDETRLKRIFIFTYIVFMSILFYLCYTVNIRFFSIDSWIIFSCFFIWIPQIFHNFTLNEIKNMPVISIIIMSTNRLLFPLYLRVLDDSFFLLHKRIFAIIIGALFLIFQNVLIYYQVKYGGSFFLPK